MTMNKAARQRTEESKLPKVFIYLFLSLWAVTTIYPFVWVILNSFRNKGEIRSDSFSIPMGDSFTFDNYLTAFDRVDIFGAYRNSLIISTAVTLVVVIIAGLAAYGLARYHFRLRPVIYSLIIAGMMFPVFSTIIPVFRMQFSWGIVNTSNLGLSQLSVILPQIAGNLSFAIIVLMGYLQSLSIEMEEAAYIEGFSLFQIYFRIVLPLIKPSLATVAIFSFLWSYNDLFTQMFFLRYRDSYTVTRLLNEIVSIAGINYGLMAAAVVLVVFPILIVYIFLQKNIIRGLTAGAIKN